VTLPLPSSSDVVIIGAGIIGLSTALFLSQRGISVTICDKGTVGCEQSSRNWGWVRKMGRDPAELPLSIKSAELWAGLNAAVGGETGFRQSGITYLCRTAGDLAKYEAWLPHARAYGLDSRILSSAEIPAILPGLTGRWEGALYTPSDARAEPSLACAAIAAHLRRTGVTILEQCAVRTVERSAGQVSGVVTEHGTIRSSRVVVAAGAWTRLFCGNLGIEFPQLRVIGSVLRTGPVAGAPEMAVAGNDFAFRKRLDGGYTIAQKNANIANIVPDSFRLLRRFLPAFRSEGNEISLRFGRAFFDELRVPRKWKSDAASPFETTRVLDPAPKASILARGLRNVTQSFPAFAGAEVLDSWAGAIDVTPDAIPVISGVDAEPGLFIAGGFSGHGFGIGPGAGLLMADLVSGGTPVVDPAPYSFARFKAA
jgi:glycine/D-amino acid oxidase-like deaminating enzyme